jgi:hypothetical protein
LRKVNLRVYENEGCFVTTEESKTKRGIRISTNDIAAVDAFDRGHLRTRATCASGINTMSTEVTRECLATQDNPETQTYLNAAEERVDATAFCNDGSRATAQSSHDIQRGARIVTEAEEYGSTYHGRSSLLCDSPATNRGEKDNSLDEHYSILWENACFSVLCAWLRCTHWNSCECRRKPVLTVRLCKISNCLQNFVACSATIRKDR